MIIIRINKINNEVVKKNLTIDDRFGLPKNHYEVDKMLEQKDGKAIIFKDGKLSYVEDLRGKVYFTDTDTETKDVVLELNFTLPKGATFDIKPSENHDLKNGKWVENQEKIIAQKKVEINQATENKINTEVGNRDFQLEKTRRALKLTNLALQQKITKTQMSELVEIGEMNDKIEDILLACRKAKGAL
jgi:hypothetical protein